MIKREDIEKVLEIADIVEVIGEFVQLKKTGANYKGLSPFTNEKTPSFIVSPTKKIFKDFSSGKGGNVLSFLMEHEQFSYPEAIRFLAKKYHVELSETVESPEEREKQNKKESLYQLNSFAAKYFQENLVKTEEGKSIALSYFKERGFSDKTIEIFELGYCLNEWDAFSKTALSKAYKKEYLIESGLTVEKDDKSIYDRFKARVMFPIHNLSGRILGFGGRILDNNKKIAKYVNSPESELYQKSKILYGLYYAKNEVVKRDVCYLVEGYTDVISLYQAGIKNVVSSSGTSLTTDQIRLIKRYTNNITILYDGDEAGIKASFRGIDMILEEGCNVRVVLFPEGQDPDSYAKNHKDFEIQEYIDKHTQDFILFKTDLLGKGIQNDPIKRTEVLQEFVRSIALIPDGLMRRAYIKEIWEKLGVAEETLNFEVNKAFRKNYLAKNKTLVRDNIEDEKIQIKSQEIDSKINAVEIYEKELIQSLIVFGNNDIVVKHTDEKKRVHKQQLRVASFVVQQLLDDELHFENPIYERIFQQIQSEKDEKGNYFVNQQFFIQNDDDEISTMVIDFLSSPYTISNNWFEKHGIYVDLPENDISLRTTIINAVILSFKSIKLRKLLADYTNKIKNCDNDNDAMMLMAQHQKTKKVLKKIDEELGHVIVHLNCN